MNTFENLQKNLEELLCILKKEEINKILIFGSYIEGNLHKDSDLDLLIVLENDYLPKTYEERMKLRLGIRKKIRSINKKIPIDLLIYTKPEYEIFFKNMNSFMREIHNTGKVIYERAG